MATKKKATKKCTELPTVGNAAPWGELDWARIVGTLAPESFLSNIYCNYNTLMIRVVQLETQMQQMTQNFARLANMMPQPAAPQPASECCPPYNGCVTPDPDSH